VEDLLKNQQRDAAVAMLAAEFTPRPNPFIAAQPLRFPPVPMPPASPRRFVEVLHPTWIKLILAHQLAGPLGEAIAAKQDADNRNLVAFLKLLEQPTVETFRAQFKPLMAGKDAYSAGELKKQVVRLLESVTSTPALNTQALAQAITADPP